MNRLTLLLLPFALLLRPSGALPAPTFTGKELARAAAAYERAREEGRFRDERDEREVNYFLGFVEGAALASRKVCVPSARGIRDQLGAATAAYLKKHPREWHLAPDTLVLKAVQPVFPCPNRTDRKGYKP